MDGLSLADFYSIMADNTDVSFAKGVFKGSRLAYAALQDHYTYTDDTIDELINNIESLSSDFEKSGFCLGFIYGLDSILNSSVPINS